MTAMAVHFSSAKDEWETPQDFFDKLNAEFGFTLDVCALPHNAKCERYFTPDDDGLSKDWEGVCWCNPPYGRTETGRWIKKAFESAQEGATVVCLIPSRTSNSWWHDYVMQAEVRFVRGRLKFVGAESGAPFPSAPFPSAVVVFSPETLGLPKSPNPV